MDDATYHARNGSWIQTFTGRQFWPLDPRGEDIDVEDIAHALAHQCRFSGHLTRFYSVAEHCVHVASLCDPTDALWGLLHDASEAYLVDIPKPLKADPDFGPAYKAVEARLMRVVCDRFGLPHAMPASVQQADVAMLYAEARDLLGPPPEEWRDLSAAAPIVLNRDDGLRPMTPEAAKAAFYSTYVRLTRPDQP